ncbi:hypothetical protein [Paralimibaculum aggregatum]|nr:hypothetical protein [Limibaculum sp. NKW23]
MDELLDKVMGQGPAHRRVIVDELGPFAGQDACRRWHIMPDGSIG